MGEDIREFTSNNDREADLSPLIQVGGDYEIYVNQGKAFFEQHKYEEALSAYTSAQDIDDTNPSLYSDKAATLTRLGCYEEALNAYDCVTALRPDDAAPHADKAYIYLEYGNYEQALKCYEAALNLDGENVQYWRNKGDLLGELGLLEEACKAYTEAITHGKDYKYIGFVYKARADTLYELKRYEEALSDCTEAINRNPTIGSWYRDRARTLEEIAHGLRESAARDYEMAKSLETIEKE
jgi:tetratricopeptide (TPR) repeat protein